jgi:hypothetical protein
MKFQYWTLQGDGIVIGDTGHIYCWTEQQDTFILQHQKAWQAERQTWSERDASIEFSKTPGIIACLNKHKKFTQKQLDSLPITWDREHPLRVKLGKLWKKYDSYLKTVRMVKSGRGNTLDATKEKARQVPVSNLLEFNNAGFAKCLWHDEKTPSMKYYQKDNRVYCFGCHRHGDVIDVAQEVYKCDFIEAIKKLCA